MPRETVEVEFENVEVPPDSGGRFARPVEGLRARCTACDETVEVRGRTQRSKLAACAMLRDQCEEPGDGRWYEPAD